ncbi:MAG: DUF11 domain-containing protein [Clostridiales bacterium]|nr:DUF11 domain-containing protein [Clostridiales bacterium]
MPAFYNQATLTYNNQTTLSNIVTGELVEVLSAAKTAASQSYRAGDTVTYAVSIVNAGSAAYTNLTVTDDLGAYPLGTGTLVPLDYVEGSVRLFVNGILQPAPTVADTQPLTITGINVPADGDAVLIYSATANQYAPAAAGSVISNTATITGAGLSAPIEATDTLPVDVAAALGIIKAINPVNVVENEPFTYTFTIQNSAATPAEATDNVTVTDTFDPIVEIQSVTLNGVPLAEGTGYTYNAATGAFATVPGVITVPAATVMQDPATGAWMVTPGQAVLTVTGTI